MLRCQQGEEQAFAELVGDWQPRLLFYIRRMVGDEHDSWEVMQQVWLGVLKGIVALRSPDHLPAWLYGIARRAILGRLRGAYRGPTHESLGVDLPADDPAAGHFEDAEQVYAALSRVSLADREVLTLFFLRDLTIRQVAAVLEVPEGTVKSRLHRAKHALRASIEQTEVRHD